MSPASSLDIVPVVSIIIPVLNEINHIDSLMNQLNDSSPVEKEVFLVDGGSIDGTRDRINDFQKEHPNFFMVDNPDRYVSQGFNKAFLMTRSKYVTLSGAHADYAPDFFSIGISYLERDECDVVGGPLDQEGKTPVGKIIAECMASKFGVGDTEFRTSRHKQYVDSVNHAIYKRELFDRVGLLDTQLVRDQDDELHYRINKFGYRILMVPEMQVRYYVRSTYRGLYKQYYEYGLYKPLVLKKVMAGTRIRHVVPAIFASYLFLLPILLLVSLLFLIPLILYLVLSLLFSIYLHSSPLKVVQSMLAFFILHFSYGTGFLMGLFKE